MSRCDTCRYCSLDGGSFEDYCSLNDPFFACRGEDCDQYHQESSARECIGVIDGVPVFVTRLEKLPDTPFNNEFKRKLKDSEERGESYFMMGVCEDGSIFEPDIPVTKTPEGITVFHIGG